MAHMCDIRGPCYSPSELHVTALQRPMLQPFRGPCYNPSGVHATALQGSILQPNVTYVIGPQKLFYDTHISDIPLEVCKVSCIKRVKYTFSLFLEYTILALCLLSLSAPSRFSPKIFFFMNCRSTGWNGICYLGQRPSAGTSKVSRLQQEE